MSMVAHRCYQMVIVAMSENVMSPESVATKGHISDERSPRSHSRNRPQDARCYSRTLITTEVFCSSIGSVPPSTPNHQMNMIEAQKMN
jgi:hypothetical protein